MKINENKKKGKRSLVVISSFKLPSIFKNKLFKNSVFLILPLVMILGGGTIGFLKNNKKENKLEIEVTKKDENKVNRRVYLISNDNLTIPLTVEMEKRKNVQEEIYDVFNLLKTSSLATSKYVKGFIDEKTKLLSFNLENECLILNFSKEFLKTNVNPQNAIEALTMSFMEFSEIDTLKLEIEGEPFEKFENSFYKVPSSLTKNIGINQIYQSSTDIINNEKVTIFYNKKYEENLEYKIPFTFYAKGKTKKEAFVNACLDQIPLTNSLSKISVYSSLSEIQSGNDYSLNVNVSSLEGIKVSKELFELVSLSYSFMGIEEKVSFILDEKEIKVDGIYDITTESVNNIIINEIKI